VTHLDAEHVVKATGKNIHEEFAARKTCQQHCGG
jgi:hypothetical protein